MSPCPGDEVCVDASCVPAGRVAFVTSLLFPGNLGDVENVNETCSSLASEAGLPGTYIAWISTEGLDPISGWPNGGPWRRTDGVEIAATSDTFFSGSLEAPLNLDENGLLVTPIPVCGGGAGVWTGTNSQGEATGIDCESWSSPPNLGTAGDALSTDGAWTADCDAPCDMMLPIYCFQLN